VLEHDGVATPYRVGHKVGRIVTRFCPHMVSRIWYLVAGLFKGSIVLNHRLAQG
jgi:hypothetical protein